MKRSQVVLDVHGRDEYEQIQPLWCGDATGDGRRELGYELFSGGAHCCFTIRVETIEGPTLLDEDLGNSGTRNPAQLDGKGALEIESTTVLANFDELSYAASPAIPRVFAFVHGRYVDATTKYPSYIRKGLRQALRDLTSRDPKELGVEGQEGLALGAFGYYVLLGEERNGLRDVTSRVPDEVANWLRAHADEAVKVIRGNGTTAGT